MILIFCAFNAEAHPIKARLAAPGALRACGLDGYAGQIAGVPVALVTTGIGVRRSRVSAARAFDSLREIDLVVISGVAGALREDLKIGQVVLSERFLTRGEEDFQPQQVLEAPSDWHAKFALALDTARIDYATGPMMTSRRPLMTSADKHRAWRDSGAISVDMESAVIALEAQHRGLPFVGMRTIMDRADEDVAGAGLADDNGHVRVMAAAKAMITNPRMIADAIHLLRNLRRATRSLASALEAVVPHLQ
jgi:nucleoside phosphorylase